MKARDPYVADPNDPRPWYVTFAIASAQSNLFLAEAYGHLATFLLSENHERACGLFHDTECKCLAPKARTAHAERMKNERDIALEDNARLRTELARWEGLNDESLRGDGPTCEECGLTTADTISEDQRERWAGVTIIHRLAHGRTLCTGCDNSETVEKKLSATSAEATTEGDER